MFKIEIISNKTNQKWGATFKNLPELEEWQSFHINANTWGLPEREVLKKELIPNTVDSYYYPQEVYLDEDVISEHLKDVSERDSEGNMITVSKTFVTLKCHYTITINDISQEYYIPRIAQSVLEKVETELSSGVAFKNTIFQCREIDIQRMTSVLGGLSVGIAWIGKWRDLNNTWVSMTETEFKEGLIPQCAGKFYPTFYKARNIIDSLYTLTSTQLSTFDLTTSWNSASEVPGNY